jgi:hypothetical protein
MCKSILSVTGNISNLVKRTSRPNLLAVATAALGMLASGTALAGAGDPAFTVVIANANGTYVGPNVTNTVSVFLTGTGGSGIASVQYLIFNGDTSEFIAQLIDTTLNNDPVLGTDFTWSVAPNPVQVTVGFGKKAAPFPGFVVQGIPTNPVVTRSFGSARTTGKGSLFPLRVYASVDPFGGEAHFEITGTPLGDGEVTLGIDGLQVETNTFNALGAALSDDQIMEALEGELATDGLTDASINLGDDEVAELNVSTGDPLGTDGADPGAFMDTTDPGLTTYADVVIPEPGTLSLMGFGALALLIARRSIRRKS